MYLFSHSTGKSVGDTEKLWGSLNETKQEIREIQAKKNKLVAGVNTSLDADNTSGNPESVFIQQTIDWKDWKTSHEIS